MERLLRLLTGFREYLLLLAFLSVSLVLFFLNDTPQLRALRGYTVGLVGSVQGYVTWLPRFLDALEDNQDLRRTNIQLADEVNRLRESRLENIRLRRLMALKESAGIDLVAAEVVGKDLSLQRNTITLNVGTDDGVGADMPIITERGLVGKVILASPGYAVGQLLVNRDFRVSAQVQRSRALGIVRWTGTDPTRSELANVVKSVDVKRGDVVLTSPYSPIFPADLRIGVVDSVLSDPNGIFWGIRLRNSVDFNRLEEVFVVRARPDSQRVALEAQLAPTGRN